MDLRRRSWRRPTGAGRRPRVAGAWQRTVLSAARSGGSRRRSSSMAFADGGRAGWCSVLLQGRMPHPEEPADLAGVLVLCAGHRAVAARCRPGWRDGSRPWPMRSRPRGPGRGWSRRTTPRPSRYRLRPRSDRRRRWTARRRCDWLVGAAVCLAIFWTASHYVDRLQPALLGLGSVRLGLPAQRRGGDRPDQRRGRKGLFGYMLPGQRPGLGTDARRSARVARTGRLAAAGESGAAVPVRPSRRLRRCPIGRYLLGTMMGGPGALAGDGLDGAAAGPGDLAPRAVAARQPREPGGPAGALGPGQPGRVPGHPAGGGGVPRRDDVRALVLPAVRRGDRPGRAARRGDARRPMAGDRPDRCSCSRRWAWARRASPPGRSTVQQPAAGRRRSPGIPPAGSGPNAGRSSTTSRRSARGSAASARSTPISRRRTADGSRDEQPCWMRASRRAGQGSCCWPGRPLVGVPTAVVPEAGRLGRSRARAWLDRGRRRV